MVLHGGTGLTRGAVHRPHRPRLREGQHLDGAEDRVRRRAPRVPGRQPRQARPAVAASQHVRAAVKEMAEEHIRIFGSAGHGIDDDVRGRASSVPALIFDCDGVLADTERDGHRPAFNQTFAEAGLPVQLVRGGVRREAADRRRQGADGLAADRRVRARQRPARRPRGPEGAAGRLAPAQDRDLQGDGRAPGGCPARPGIARIVDEALAAGWTLAVASTSAEESVRAVLEHVVGADAAARFAVFAGDVVPAKKPDPAIYLLALERMGVDAGRRDRRRGLAQRPARRRRRRPALRRDGQRLHRATRT